MALRQRSTTATTAAPASAPTPSHTPAPMAATSEGWRLPTAWVPKLPNTKLLLYGDSGTGKSTFASTYSEAAKVMGKPLLILGFDPPSKMTPYRDIGVESVPVQDPAMAEWYASAGIEAEDVLDAQGNLLARIECYVDPDPNEPRAADAVEARLADFYNDARNWYAVVFDSMTFYQQACLRRVQKRMAFTPEKMFAKGEGIDMRQWYAVAKMDIERLIMHQAFWWPTNIVAIHHTGEDKGEFGDTVVRGILSIGKLKDALPPGFDEIYRVKLNMKERIRDASGRETEDYKRTLQTRHDSLWVATSVTAKAPNPCEPHYLALWQNWQAKMEGKGVKP
ncbi:MAG: hypothetical protein E6Q97_30830 [Desulfurellales bacterium]|nr:MAG: hypothetical protein E6Q97_30830 [Desulfurellales bacterium]